MKLPEIQTHQNGNYRASSGLGEALPMPRASTEFPEMQMYVSIRTLLYYIDRVHLGSASIGRWLFVLLILIGFIGILREGVGRWIVSSLCLIAIAGLFSLLSHWRKRDFVYFEAEPLPSFSSSLLSPQHKVAVHVTGYFSVEGKFSRFTWLPGFYRTFATREHALLCLLRERKYLKLGKWIADEIGMWYIFFIPQDIVDIQWGKLYFDGTPHCAIAVDHKVTVPARNRFRREQEMTERVYIVSHHQDESAIILADLLHDRPHIGSSADSA